LREFGEAVKKRPMLQRTNEEVSPRAHPGTGAGRGQLRLPQQIWRNSTDPELQPFSEVLAMRKRLSALAIIAMSVVSFAAMLDATRETEARANKQRDFIIAGSDGYGTQDCLAAGSSCGRIVADAWCESKGFKSALAYRKLAPDEVTGSTKVNDSGVVPDSFLISCKE
jgi:hypothetical protein